jgi:hypothetical protein
MPVLRYYFERRLCERFDNRWETREDYWRKTLLHSYLCRTIAVKRNNTFFCANNAIPVLCFLLTIKLTFDPVVIFVFLKQEWRECRIKKKIGSPGVLIYVLYNTIFYRWAANLVSSIRVLTGRVNVLQFLHIVVLTIWIRFACSVVHESNELTHESKYIYTRPKMFVLHSFYSNPVFDIIFSPTHIVQSPRWIRTRLYLYHIINKCLYDVNLSS